MWDPGCRFVLNWDVWMGVGSRNVVDSGVWKWRILAWMAVAMGMRMRFVDDLHVCDGRLQGEVRYPHFSRAVGDGQMWGADVRVPESPH